jgi:mercuric ion transport protein
MGKEQDQKTGGVRLLAITALVSALAASSCCVLPLLFVTVGISGAWIGALTSLAPYQPIFLTVAAAAIAAGFWSVYRRRAACAGPDCGTPLSQRLTKAALWAGLVVLIVAGSAEWWARLLA